MLMYLASILRIADNTKFGSTSEGLCHQIHRGHRGRSFTLNAAMPDVLGHGRSRGCLYSSSKCHMGQGRPWGCGTACVRLSACAVDCSSGVALGSGLIISRYCSMGGLWVGLICIYAPPPLLRLARFACEWA